MRQTLRSWFIKISGTLELLLSLIVLCSIVISAADLIKTLCVSTAQYFQTGQNALDFKLFLSLTIQLIIGVEFVKMLSNHSPASAIEVVLFVIAKRIIVDESTSFEMLLGVIALALLFVVRKYLLSAGSRLDEGYLFKADTTIEEVAKTCKVHIPKNLGNTLAEVVENEFARLDKTMREREKLVLEDASIMIYAMEGDRVTVFEVWNRKSRG